MLLILASDQKRNHSSVGVAEHERLADAVALHGEPDDLSVVDNVVGDCDGEFTAPINSLSAHFPYYFFECIHSPNRSVITQKKSGSRPCNTISAETGNNCGCRSAGI